MKGTTPSRKPRIAATKASTAPCDGSVRRTFKRGPGWNPAIDRAEAESGPLTSHRPVLLVASQFPVRVILTCERAPAIFRGVADVAQANRRDPPMKRPCRSTLQSTLRSPIIGNVYLGADQARNDYGRSPAAAPLERVCSGAKQVFPLQGSAFVRRQHFRQFLLHETRQLTFVDGPKRCGRQADTADECQHCRKGA
jgi:hypothetical protein